VPSEGVHSQLHRLRMRRRSNACRIHRFSTFATHARRRLEGLTRQVELQLSAQKGEPS
jgi:hypothetical protein